MFRTLRRAFPRLGRWPRLGAAGICLLLALNSAVGGSRDRAAASRTITLVVAARFVPAGRALTAHDLTLTRWPAALDPHGSRDDLHSLIGQRTAGPIAEREAVTTTRLVGADLSAGLPAGENALAITLDDPRAGELVHRGDRVDLLATPRASDVDDTASPLHEPVDTVASAVLVLDLVPMRNDAQSELIIAADRVTTLDITARRNSEAFTAVLLSS